MNEEINEPDPAPEEPGEFVMELPGKINGKPSTLTVDFRELVALAAERRGEEVPDEELDRRARECVDFRRTWEEAKQARALDPEYQKFLRRQEKVARASKQLARLLPWSR